MSKKAGRFSTLFILPVIFIAVGFLTSFRNGEYFDFSKAEGNPEVAQTTTFFSEQSSTPASLKSFSKGKNKSASTINPTITAPPNLDGNTSDNGIGDCFTTVTPGEPTTTGDVDISAFIAGVKIDPKTYLFPVGTTTIVWTAKDKTTNISVSDTQLVTVTDDEKPIISGAVNISTTTDPGKCEAEINIVAPSTTDNCEVGPLSGSRNDGLPLDAPYPKGKTVIIWEVIDANGISATPVTQEIDVRDEEAPVITKPENITQSADPGKCDAMVSISVPEASDNCESVTPTAIRSDNLALSAPFPVGTTTIYWNETDDTGNEALTVTQDIIVVDNEKPVISVPSDIIHDADPNECEAVIDISIPGAFDNCKPVTPKGTRSDNLDLNAPYPVGITTISWNIKDEAENAASIVIQKITVEDKQKPVISVPADITVDADPNACDAVISIPVPEASDNCDSVTPVGTRSDNLALNAPYPVGTITISWNVKDESENVASTITQKITVEDKQKPVISVPADITVDADPNACDAVISIPVPEASDNCDPVTPVGTRSDNLALNAPYPVGTITISWNVKDESENAASTVTQKITVEDKQKPIISVPAEIKVDADPNACDAVISIPVPEASDNCDPVTPVGSRSDNLALNAPYPVGTTLISWYVVDSAGNTATTVDQGITVQDKEIPVISEPLDISVNSGAGLCGANLEITPPAATDNCTSVVPVAKRSDGKSITEIFPVGITTITWEVSDASENDAVPVDQVITVTDTEVPVISQPAPIHVLSSADGPGDCFAFLNITPPTASDNCSVGTPVGTRSDGKPMSEIFPVGTLTVTWNVKDTAGNPASPVVQTIVVEDDEDPILPHLDPVISGCEITVPVPVAIDNCLYEITGATTDPTTISSPGTHTIEWTFTDKSGNSVSTTQQVEIIPLTLEISKTDVLCNGFSSGEATAKASGGIGPYTYSWGTMGAGANKTDLPAGKYTVTATDANGCTITDSVEISEPDTFIDIISVKTTSGCFGENNGTATVVVEGGMGDYSYVWDNGLVSDVGPTATGLAPGNHTVQVTDGNGCSTVKTVQVSAPTKLEISGFQTTETIYYGTPTGTATVQVSGGSPTYSFLWSNGQTGQTATNLSAGTYDVTVRDSNGCETTKTVTIIDSLEAKIVATSVCNGENKDVIRTSTFTIENGTAIGGIPGYSYNWDFGEGATPATATGPGPHVVNYNFIGDKEIKVIVTDNSSSVTGNNNLVYENRIIQYVGGCFSDDCGSNDLTLENYFIGDANGHRITSENCATTDQKFIYITIPSSPDRYSLYLEVIYSVQDLETGVIKTELEDGCFYRYQAIPDLAKTIPIQYECGDIVKIEGVYLTFQNNKNRDCGATQGNGNNPKCYSTNNEATVISPLFAVAFPNRLLCNGAEDGMITVRASGGTAPYSYSLNSGSYQSSNIFTGLAGGVYSIKVKDADGKIFDLTTEIEQPLNELTIEEVENVPVTCNGGSDGSAKVRASGGTPNGNGEYIYVWENIGQTTPEATNLQAGTYLVRVIDSNGCQVELEVTIEEPDPIPAVAGPDQVLICGDTTTYLQAQYTQPEGETDLFGEWSLVNGPQGASFEDVHDPHTLFTGAAGTYTLRWTVPCGAHDDVKITISNCSTIDFDGVDDYIDFGNNFSLSGNFTIEGWIKQDVTSTSGKKTIFSKRDFYNSAGGGYDLTIENNYPTFNWNTQSLKSKFQIGSGRWYHIAVISKEEGTSLYVDGILVTDAGVAQALPATTDAPFLMGATYNSATPEIPKNLYHGWIEEVRIWNTALTEDQLRFMMNQHLVKNGDLVKGEVLPMDVPGNLSWDHLMGYYYLDNATDGKTKGIAGTPSPEGKLHNILTTQQRTAPLPYFTVRAGDWGNITPTATPWRYGQGIWDQPNGNGVNGEPIKWNIAKISHRLNAGNRDITLLGLISEAEKLSIPHATKANQATLPGQSLTLTHYLELNGTIDLIGESQLLQDEGSILAESSKGFIQRDQQGTRNSYNYNYWSSPVSNTGAANNSGFTIKGVLRDGTFPENPKDILFNYQYHWADGARTSPIRLSSYWMNLYTNFSTNTYSAWKQVRETGAIKTGEGYTMKGTSGWAQISDRQNYVFIGKPNNGDITLEISDGNDYLVGNPYPSALDSKKFIEDNIDTKSPADSANVFNGTLYFWDHFGYGDHYLQNYIGGYGAINLFGIGVAAAATDERINANGAVAPSRPERYIPVGQGFYISTREVDSEVNVTGGPIKFRNAQRIFVTDDNGEGGSVFKSREGTKSKEKEAEKRMMILLKFHSPTGYNREILVGVDPSTSDGFDQGYDAPLFDNVKEDMYWLIKDKKFVIQGVPDFKKSRELALGIKTAAQGEFTIEIEDLKNIPAEFEIYLKDSVTQERHDLRNEIFRASDTAGVKNNRYYLVFKNIKETDPGNTENPGEETPEEGGEAGTPEEGETGGNNPEEGGESGTPGEGEPEEGGQEVIKKELDLLYLQRDMVMMILNPDLLDLYQVQISNILGQKVQAYRNLPKIDEIKLEVRGMSPGVYIITLDSENGSLQKKIIIE